MACSSLDLSSLSAEDLGKIVQRRLNNRDGAEDFEILSRPLSEEESSFLEVLHSRAVASQALPSEVPSGSSGCDSAVDESPSAGSAAEVSSDSVTSSASSFDPEVQRELARLEERLMMYFDSRFGGNAVSDDSSSGSEESDEEVCSEQPSNPPAPNSLFDTEVKYSPLKKSKFAAPLQSLFFRGPVSSANDGWKEKDCWDFVWSKSDRKKILKSYPPMELFNPKSIRFNKDDWDLTSKEEKEFDATLRSILDEALIPLRICASWSLVNMDSETPPPVFVDLVQGLRNMIAKICEARLLLISSPESRALVRNARGDRFHDPIPTRVEQFVESEHKKRKHMDHYMPSRKKSKGSSGSGSSSGSKRPGNKPSGNYNSGKKKPYRKNSSSRNEKRKHSNKSASSSSGSNNSGGSKGGG